LILARVLSPPHSRLAGLAELAAVALAVLGAGVAVSPEARVAVARVLSSSQGVER